MFLFISAYHGGSATLTLNRNYFGSVKRAGKYPTLLPFSSEREGNKAPMVKTR
jgi:hypothetical protein